YSQVACHGRRHSVAGTAALVHASRSPLTEIVWTFSAYVSLWYWAARSEAILLCAWAMAQAHSAPATVTLRHPPPQVRSQTIRNDFAIFVSAVEPAVHDDGTLPVRVAYAAARVRPMACPQLPTSPGVKRANLFVPSSCGEDHAACNNWRRRTDRHCPCQ